LILTVMAAGFAVSDEAIRIALTDDRGAITGQFAYGAWNVHDGPRVPGVYIGGVHRVSGRGLGHRIARGFGTSGHPRQSSDALSRRKPEFESPWRYSRKPSNPEGFCVPGGPALQ
jgi:hypothetical protein